MSERDMPSSAAQDSPRVAIVGGGIAGLACAYYLKGHCRSTLFERADRLGGHVHAVEVPLPSGEVVAVETGFLAFHRSHYPELVRLLDTFAIETTATGVGLGIWDEGSDLCFDSQAWFSLFGGSLPSAGRNHLADLLVRLSRHHRCPEADTLPNHRLDQYLKDRGYDEALARYVIWPSVAALWGFQPAEIMAMSTRTVADSLNRFFISAHAEPFERIVPSTDAWLGKLRGALDATLALGTEVCHVRLAPGGAGVWVETPRGIQAFDAVILATHADRALALLDTPTPRQREILGAFTYHASTSVVHTDTGILPQDRARWTDYNYRARCAGTDALPLTTTTWNMSRIQGLATADPVLVTVGPRGFVERDFIDHTRILATVDYDHPASPPAAVAARPALDALGREGPLFFCGSYFGSTGSNECAIASAALASWQVLTKLPGLFRKP